jgi:hypothetical protein
MVKGHIKMKKKVQGKKPAAKPCRSTPKKKPAYGSQICIEDCCWKKPGIHPAIGQASIQPQTDFSSDEDLVVPGMPALQKKTKPPQVTGYYFTVATDHDPHVIIRKRTPSMYMQVGTTAVQLLGYMAQHDLCIGGTGTIIRRTDEELAIYQPENGSDCIGTETSMGQNYGGFESAIVKPFVPGSLVYTQMINPDAESDEDCVVGARSRAVVTENGDISCLFTISSFNATEKKPLRFMHLMRPMHPRTVRILEATAIMRRGIQHTSSVSQAIFDVEQALMLDSKTGPLALSMRNHAMLKLPS